MAYMPCDIGRHVNPGRNVNAYFALGSGGTFDRWNLRLCSGHWQSFHDDLAQFEVDFSEPALSRSDLVPYCVTCGEPVGEGGRQLFVTSYPAKNDRKDYWSKLHDNCSLPVGWASRSSRGGA